MAVCLALRKDIFTDSETEPINQSYNSYQVSSALLFTISSFSGSSMFIGRKPGVVDLGLDFA